MKHNIISRIFALITLMALLSIGVQAFSDSAYLQRGEVIGTPADEGGGIVNISSVNK